MRTKNKRLAIYLAGGAAASAIAVTVGVLAAGPSDGGKPDAAATVITTRPTNAGPILADGAGRTVYLFVQDTGSTPTCTGACTSYWPPVPASAHVRAAGDAGATDLSSVAAPGGGRQLTYAGHPLYYFAGDTKPGATAGQALDQFGAPWYVLDPAGKAITTPVKTSGGASSNGGAGSGYGGYGN